MGLFEFIKKNSETLSDLDLSKDGEVKIPPGDFDFSDQKLEVEIMNSGFKFTVKERIFKLVCRIELGEIGPVIGRMKMISSADIRKSVIEAMDTTFRSELKDDKDKAEATLVAAQDAVNESTKQYDDMVEAFRNLKNNWMIP